MAKKKFSKEYLEKTDKMLRQSMYDEPGAQDWTQISLSIRDAMLAAATVFGSPTTDEQKDKLHALLTELTVGHALQNLTKYDITVTPKED
ncbi:MAG: hypothetical protein IJ588_01125 [Prevotella sp.]|nr:hypothetical protein [Prevotella sp.]